MKILRNNWRWIVLILSLGMIVWRAPGLIVEPRFWAEEGTRYFRTAFAYSESPSWYRGLLQIQRGYFALWPNLAVTAAANLVPLEEAPRITTGLALLVQLAAIAALLWLECELWRHWAIKAISVLGMLFVPLSGEIWLNTINSQFVLAVISFVILHAHAQQSRLLQWFSRLLLGIAGLTGAVSILLTPLFLFKALHDKTRERTIQATILSASALLQAVIMLLAASDTQSTLLMRWTDTDWQSLVSALWTQSIGLMLVGLENARSLAAWLSSLRATDAKAFNALCLVLAACAIGFLWAVSLPLRRCHRITLLGSYLSLIVISIAGALPMDKLSIMAPGVAERYFYAPNTILALTTIGSLQMLLEGKSQSARSRWMLVPIGILMAASLTWGMLQFKPTTQFDANWPIWKQEVQIWRDRPEYELNVWPLGWKTPLTKKEQ